MRYSNKSLKTEAYHASVKEKDATAPSASSDNYGKSVSSHLHWKDDGSHIISNMRLKDPTHPKVGAEGLKDDSISKGKMASQTEKIWFLSFIVSMVDDN